LTFDVVAQFDEPGSEALLTYVSEYGPTHLYFGHVHQPRASEVMLGETRLVNVGAHYRTTGRAWEHSA
jgi:Icc-related predicted phosphoesterase